MSSIGQPLLGFSVCRGQRRKHYLKNKANHPKIGFGGEGVSDMLYTLLAVIRAVLAEFVEYLLHRLCTA